MPNTIVAFATASLTPDRIKRIAARLNINEQVAEKALLAGVPALLAALLSSLDRPGGAERLADSISYYVKSTGAAGITASGGDEAAPLANGSQMLTSLLGEHRAGMLASIIDSFAGTGGMTSKAMLSAALPAVLGGIAQVAGASKRSAAEALLAEREIVMRSMPEGMGDMLAAIGLGGGRAAPVSGDGRRPVPTQRSRQDWIVPALMALVATIIAWQVLARRDAMVSPQSPVTSTAPAPALESLRGIRVGDVDVGAQIHDAVSGTRSSLDGVRDRTTAEAAAPQLEKNERDLSAVLSLIGQLPADSRKLIAQAVRGFRPAFDVSMARVMAVPGVDALLSPTLDAMRKTLDAMAEA